MSCVASLLAPLALPFDGPQIRSILDQGISLVVSYSSPADGLRERYVVECELGRGGMATVFLTHDIKHDRPVALKVVHAPLDSGVRSPAR